MDDLKILLNSEKQITDRNGVDFNGEKGKATIVASTETMFIPTQDKKISEFVSRASRTLTFPINNKPKKR